MHMQDNSNHGHLTNAVRQTFNSEMAIFNEEIDSLFNGGMDKLVFPRSTSCLALPSGT